MQNEEKLHKVQSDLEEIKKMLYGLYDIIHKENQSFDHPLDHFRAMDINLRQKLERILWDNAFNLPMALKWQSTLSAAEFVKNHIGVEKHMSNYELRQQALAGLPNDGLFLEFGVFRGFWLNIMSEIRPDVRFFGFDSFEGLPSPWSFYPKGYFDLKGTLPEVRENVTLIKGWFEDTLQDFLKEHTSPIHFIDLDCDLYAPSKFVLNCVRQRIHKGTKILLDDFLTQPNWENEQFKAWQEWVSENGIEYDYIGYAREIPCTTVVVEITKC